VSALRAVFLHELQRSLTAGRIAWWFAMAAFPVLITALIVINDDFSRNMRPANLDTFWSILLYVFIPCVCCSLSVLLTAAPAVATELEQRSWVYMATRPNGIFWLLAVVSGQWAVVSNCKSQISNLRCKI